MNTRYLISTICILLCECNSGMYITGNTNSATSHPVRYGGYSFDKVDNESALPEYMGNVFNVSYRIPKTETGRPLPTIILQPGFFSWTTQLDDVQNSLASYGFLVVGVNNTSHFKIITTSLEPYKEAILETIQYIIQSNVTIGHPLYGRIDTSAIGICGHSLGGGGVLLACDAVDVPVNEYIKTAVAMNPYGKCRCSNTTIPVMLFSSDLDSSVNPFMPEVNASARNVFASFLSLKSPVKLFANFKNMDHNGVVDKTIFLSTSGNAEIFLPTMIPWFKAYLAGDKMYEVYLDSKSIRFSLLKGRFTEKCGTPAYFYHR